MARQVLAAGAGLMTAALAQFVALLLSGAGHAWVEPFFFSAAMWFALPLMAVRLVRSEAAPHKGASVDLAVLLSGLALDALLVLATVQGGGRMFPIFASGGGGFARAAAAGLPLVLLWTALWLSWQLAAFLLWFRACGRPGGGG